MMAYLQRMGRSLMLPIAVLPAAALLLGFGYLITNLNGGEEMMISALMTKAGDAILGHIATLFAVGLAFGMAKEKDGAAAITGIVAFLTITTLLSPETVASLKGIDVESVDMAFEHIEKNVFIGILSGLIAAATYNGFSQIKLPDFLAFFSGKRLPSIMVAGMMIIISLIMLFLWPILFGGLVAFGTSISELGAVGAGIYGFFNRLLIPVGLHHALNSVFWFDTVGINDIGNFWSGEGEKGITGRYQAGFFPVMMFGLPAACLAMYHTANKENKKMVGSLLSAAALTAFLTGVTEPIEFSFMFLAPVLYVIHALLMGLSLFIAASFQWIAGFAFSGGAIDFFLSSSLPLANKPYMLILQGLVFALIYYFVFRFAILKFDLKTPGRTQMKENVTDLNTLNKNQNSDDKYDQQAVGILKGLGGASNIKEVNYCTTRLRLEVKDAKLINESQIKDAGAYGVKKISDENVHVVVGTHVERVAEAFKKYLTKG